MSALFAYIDELIKNRGPISVAEYMELALQHPEFGYYRRHDPIGRQGDFITAPEISQMFGEMIGLWCADVWRAMDRPEKFVLLELGPGRGTLLQDALRATAKIHGFQQCLRLCILECNETLRQMQQEKLAEFQPVFLEDLESLPDAPIIAIANEFFDALPIRQFEKTFNGWCERRVAVEDGRLGFVSYPLDPALSLLVPRDMQDALPGTVHEISLTSLAIMRDLSRQILKRGGAALIMDYGYVESSGKPTLQAIVKHEYADVLERPGDADVTAHVDFAALRNTAAVQGTTVMGPLGQGEFLRTLGIELRADQLKLGATPMQVKDIESALHRLTDPSEMGALFKVMAITGPQLSTLPGL